MLEDLLLLRVWAAPDAGRGETRSKVAADLRPLGGEEAGNLPLWRNHFATAVERLAEAGCLTTSGRGGARLALGEAGRARVRHVFKIQEGASTGQRKGRSKGWTWWRDHHALPLALNAGAAGGTADELRRTLLRRYYLPEWPPGQVLDSLPKMVDLLLAKRLKVKRVSPAGFRQALLRGWAFPSSLEAPTPSPSDQRMPVVQGRLPDTLPTFAEQSRLAARRSPTGRFGDKVFISHVWRALLAAGQAAPGEADTFKARLVQANTAGFLRLSRADLTGAHGVEDVRDSEMHYLGETFHFLRLD